MSNTVEQLNYERKRPLRFAPMVPSEQRLFYLAEPRKKTRGGRLDSAFAAAAPAAAAQPPPTATDYHAAALAAADPNRRFA
jgi:hypothetical protein